MKTPVTMPKWPAYLLGAVAAACAYPAVTTPIPESYRALGNEPFWSVTIADGRMRYDAPNGPRFSVSAPSPRTTFNGHRYETERLSVDVTHGECSDGMSDRRYADTVMVIVEGRTLRGCGGAILPPASLADTTWSIVEIDGQGVQGHNYMLQFTADRMGGQAGCNRFTGSYTMSGETLTPGAIAATRMACPGPGMDHEQSAFRVLNGPVRVTHPDGETLVLSGNGGTIRLRRSI